MAVEKMKVKPSRRRLIRSISSWMPRSNWSGSAKSGLRRSRNTLLTILAAGMSRSSVDRRFMGIIIRNQLPSSSIFCRDRHSANARNSRGPTDRWRSLPAARPPCAGRRRLRDRRGDAPSPGRFSATGNRRDKRDGESPAPACASGIAARREGPRVACGAMRSSFPEVKPNRPRPANLPGSSSARLARFGASP